MKLKKILFELLISPLTISNNYYLNSMTIGLIGIVAFKIAFKIVGNIGIRGEIGSLLHWIIRFLVFILLWVLCCLVVNIVKFVINHLFLLLTIFIVCFIFYKLISTYEVNLKK